MKTQLAIGLGNPLMGDDGVGCAVAERLASHPRLPEDVEVLCGGTDLLGCASRMEGRSRVTVIDAVQCDGEPGSVVLVEGEGAGTHQEHAHHLSAVQAIRLLEMTTTVRFRLLGVAISSAGIGGLSPALAGRMPAIVERVIEELRAG